MTDVCCEIHIKHIYALSGQLEEFLNVKLSDIHKATTKLYAINAESTEAKFTSMTTVSC
jgi:hypothetical protein